MQKTTETLVRQHLAYASAHPEEYKQFKTISDHMVHYCHAVLGMSKSETSQFLADFRSRNGRSQDIYRFVNYLRQPATSTDFAVYAVFVQAHLPPR
jgi:hypothetical protein